MDTKDKTPENNFNEIMRRLLQVPPEDIRKPKRKKRRSLNLRNRLQLFRFAKYIIAFIL